ncbi:MAG: DsbA family protein [Proteobacteria bacterium]|nr:DsbA family protein [Pseudomonadota bacterium]
MNRAGAFLALILIVAIGFGAWLYFGRSADDTPEVGADVVSVSVLPEDRTLGNPKAPITVVEYAAPQCPVCARMNEEGFPTLKSQYIDAGKVYYVFRITPIGPADVPAEGIASCLPKDQYFKFIDMLFRTQPKWDPEYGVTDVEGGLIAAAHAAGLSTDKARSCMTDPNTLARIARVAEYGATRYGVTGTPTFIVDDKVLEAGLPWTGVKAAIDAALASKS